jgi:endonuclease-3
VPTKWDDLLGSLSVALSKEGLPSVTEVAQRRRDPFGVLVSTVISLRTKDEVTAEASKRLLERAPTPEVLVGVEEEDIERLIYPAGFYRTKAKNLKKIAAALIDQHGGGVPADMERLLELPGVGRKTANLVRNLGFGLDGICVDTHVHRISNRTGWVSTRTPDQTERALMATLPRQHWKSLNTLLVQFGKAVCTPVSPWCSRCPFSVWCPRNGVDRSR